MGSTFQNYIFMNSLFSTGVANAALFFFSKYLLIESLAMMAVVSVCYRIIGNSCIIHRFKKVVALKE